MMTKNNLNLKGIDEFLNFKIEDMLNREFGFEKPLSSKKIIDNRFYIIDLVDGVPKPQGEINGLIIKKEKNSNKEQFNPLISLNNVVIQQTYNLIIDEQLDKPLLINTVGSSNIKITSTIKSTSIIEVTRNIGDYSAINNRFFSINNSNINYTKIDLEQVDQNSVYNYSGDINSGFFTGVTINKSGPLGMNIWEMDLLGHNSQCHISGIIKLNESNRHGTICKIRHKSQKTKSSQDFRHVLDDSSYAMYDGESNIRSDAIDSVSSQNSKTIVLSENSRILNKPRLNIFTGEVKATHGASVGKLNQDDIFYLKQRGLKDKLIKEILIKAFTEDLIERIPSSTVKEFVYEKI